MKKIPLKIRSEIADDPFFSKCALADDPEHVCMGRLTWHHPFIFGGCQVVAKFGTVPACAKSHGADGYNADQEDLEKLELIALNRASDSELDSISKAINYRRRREYLKDRLSNEPVKQVFVQPGAVLTLQMAFNF